MNCSRYRGAERLKYSVDKVSSGRSQSGWGRRIYGHGCLSWMFLVSSWSILSLLASKFTFSSGPQKKIWFNSFCRKSKWKKAGKKSPQLQCIPVHGKDADTSWYSWEYCFLLLRIRNMYIYPHIYNIFIFPLFSKL